MHSIETDDVLYRILSTNAALTATITGGVYAAGERPDNSELEDIVVNTISLTHEHPQSGASNVNIHVPDIELTVRGQQQRKTDRERLRTLTGLVLSALEAAREPGLTIQVVSDTTIKETQINQSYQNIRVNWNIAKRN